MATKAERFRYLAERSGPPQPKHPKPRRDLVVDTSKPGVSATDRKAGGNSTAGRNRSQKALNKSAVTLEDSATGRPSRKSSRRSATHSKSASSLSRRQTRRIRSPKARATRAGARSR